MLSVIGDSYELVCLIFHVVSDCVLELWSDDLHIRNQYLGEPLRSRLRGKFSSSFQK